MRLFEDEPTMEIIKGSAFGQSCLEKEMAVCRFYLDEQCVYEAADGSYFSSPMPEDEKEFFFYGQMEPVQELDALEPDYEEQVSSLKDGNRAVNPFSFQLLAINREAENKPLYSLYSAELQAYFVLTKASFDALTADTHRALAKLQPAANRLSWAYPLVLDENGGVVRVGGLKDE